MPQTNVVLTGHIPVSATLLVTSAPITSTTGGDFASGYVNSGVIPTLGTGQSLSLTWSVASSRSSAGALGTAAGCFLTRAHLSSDQVQPLTSEHYLCRMLFPVVYRNASFGR